MMKRDDLLNPAVDWTDENWAQRLDRCASMLFLHGYITETARDKIGARLTKHFEAAAHARGWVKREDASQ